MCSSTPINTTTTCCVMGSVMFECKHFKPAKTQVTILSHGMNMRLYSLKYKATPATVITIKHRL